MRIGLVCPFDPWPENEDASTAHVGGVERSIGELARALALRGHSVRLIHSHDARDEPGPVPHERIKRVPLRRAAKVLRAPVVHDLGNLPDDLDVIQTPATYPVLTPNILSWAKRQRVPSVIDFHFEPQGNGVVGRLATAAYMPIASRTYGHADALVVRSRAYAAGRPSLRRIPTALWHEIPNGLDGQRFTVDGPAAEGDYLLTVGRLVPYKGVSTLIAALEHLDDAPPLRVAGDGPLRQSLERQAEQRGVPVEFLGKVADDELPALYRGARMTILPSVNGQEAFGMTLIESMACGTPVVASDLPGVGDVARRGGMVAPPRDPVALAEVIRQMLAAEVSPDPRTLSEATHRAFEWTRVAQRFERVYRSILEPIPRQPDHFRGATPEAPTLARQGGTSAWTH